jgi:hypothetical protein
MFWYFEHFVFGFVSDFDIRISDFIVVVAGYVLRVARK